LKEARTTQVEHELRVECEVGRKAEGEWLIFPIIGELGHQTNKHAVQPPHHIKCLLGLCFEHCHSGHQDSCRLMEKAKIVSATKRRGGNTDLEHLLVKAHRENRLGITSRRPGMCQGGDTENALPVCSLVGRSKLYQTLGACARLRNERERPESGV